MIDLTGKLLIAMPGMGDPRFEHSVVFLCSHSDEGAMGLIVNKPARDVRFFDLLEQLVAHGVPLDIRDRDGDTPLLTAIHHGVARVPSYLLSVGADPNARNHAGSTPLIGAAKRGRAPLVRQLLDAGADPSAALPDGTTAADAATGEAADLLSA